MGQSTPGRGSTAWPKRRSDPRIALAERLEERRLLSTIYVDAIAPGPTHNGSSWTNAYTDLQQALGVATSGTTIDIGQGTYKPTSGTDRTATFQIGSGVSIFGGYAGYGTSNPNSRDVVNTPTVLSGDIGSIGINTDNSYSVVTLKTLASGFTLDGLTISNGYGNGSTPSGGGVYTNSAASGSIDNCTFNGNYANRGGGVYIYSSTLSFQNCSFLYNSAFQGGAVYNSFQTPFIGCTFQGNHATNGGAIYNAQGERVTLTNSIFSGNFVSNDPTYGGPSYGGAIYNYATSPSQAAVSTLINCTVAGNSASGPLARGGGIYNSEWASSSTLNCIIWGNTSPQEPASGADPLFIRNPSPGPDGVWGTADDDFGNLQISPASPMVDAGNNSSVTAGITTDIAGNPRFADVPTTPDTGSGTAPIVDMGAYEAVPALAASSGGPYIVLQGQNITLSGRGASNVAGALQYAWGWNGDGLFDDATGTNPVVPTSSMAAGTLLNVSLKVTDAANHSVVSATTIRIAPLTAYVDSRATSGNNNGSSWSNAYTSLSSAMAQATAGETIRVATGTYRPTISNYRTLSFKLAKNIALYGGYAGYGASNPDARSTLLYPSILSGDIGATNDNSDNSFHVVDASGTDATSVLDGFTVAAGNANGLINAGGGLYCDLGSPTINNCTFVANSGSGSGGAVLLIDSSAPALHACTFTANAGGAVCIEGSSSNVSACTFQGNTAPNGWGAAIHIDTSGTVTLSNCNFSGNSALYGGAASDSSGTTVTYTNCTFTQNHATNGGALYNSAVSPTILDCTFDGNTATRGGAINYQSASTPNVYNCLFVGNTAAQDGGAVYGDATNMAFYECTLAYNLSPSRGGGVSSLESQSYTFQDCVLWGNSAPTGSQYYAIGASNVSYSDIQGGVTGSNNGGGNINSDPLFVRAASPGPDTVWSSADDDYGDLRLQSGSPCIDTGSGVPSAITKDLAGKSRTLGKSVDMGAYEHGTPATVTGTSGADNYYARLSSDGTALQVWNGTSASGNPAYSFATSSTESLTFNTSTGNDQLIVDETNGMDADIALVSDSSGDKLFVTGLPATAIVNSQSGMMALSATNITVTSGVSQYLDAPSGSTLPLGSLYVGGNLSVNSGKQLLLDVSQFTVASAGSLNLNDNDMIVRGGSLTTISPLLKSGFNSGVGYWNGATGIVSSVAASDSTQLHALGDILNNNGSGQVVYSSFDGDPVSTTDVLIKYTYYGDANADGHVDGTDYSLIDNGFAKKLTGWVNGDFNYDGQIDGSDYSLMDNAFNQQSPASPAALVVGSSSTIASAQSVARVMTSEPVTASNFVASAGILSSPPSPGTSASELLDDAVRRRTAKNQ
jgi:predicted outer membrane repeat protein